MSAQWLSLKDALSYIAGEDYHRISGDRQIDATRWLTGKAAGGVIEVRGNFGGREFELIPPSRFIASPSFDAYDNALVWLGRAAESFAGAESVDMPAKVRFGDYNARGRLTRAVVRLVMVNGEQLALLLGKDTLLRSGPGTVAIPVQYAVPAVKRGRRPNVDPDRFKEECHRWLEENGVPDPSVDPKSSKAELERHMMKFHKEALETTQNRVRVNSAIASYVENIGRRK